MGKRVYLIAHTHVNIPTFTDDTKGLTSFLSDDPHMGCHWGNDPEKFVRYDTEEEAVKHKPNPNDEFIVATFEEYLVKSK